MPRAVQIELCQPRAPAFYRAMQDVILYRNGRVEAGGDGAFDGLKNSRERATPRTRQQGLGAPCPHAADMCPAAALIERICCAALRNSAFCTCAATSGNSASTSRPRNLSGSSSKKLTAAASGVCPSLTSSGNFVRLALAGYGSARAQLNGSRRSTCVCCPARATTMTDVHDIVYLSPPRIVHVRHVVVAPGPEHPRPPTPALLLPGVILVRALVPIGLIF
jgi:hypothetical protein